MVRGVSLDTPSCHLWGTGGAVALGVPPQAHPYWCECLALAWAQAEGSLRMTTQEAPWGGPRGTGGLAGVAGDPAFSLVRNPSQGDEDPHSGPAVSPCPLSPAGPRFGLQGPPRDRLPPNGWRQREVGGLQGA